MNVLPFLAFLFAAILKLVGVHQDLIVWLLIIGGLLLSVSVVPFALPWRRNN